MPDNSPSSAEFLSAELCGLPQRAASPGRDKFEEIASLYLDRLRSGEAVDVNDFANQYPSIADDLREFLPMVAAMEDWKVQREFKSYRSPLPEQFEITQLGDFRIVREIARGGMGVVFEAVQPMLNRRVAVKLLPWKFPRNSSWAEQFIREARTAAQLQHQNIVPVYSFGEHDQRYFYAMQFVRGIGLDKLIQGWDDNKGIVDLDVLIERAHPSGNVEEIQRLQNNSSSNRRLLRHGSWIQIGKIATQIASAIRYAHRSGTLHRDIKPGNLLIDQQGKIWVTDFGLAMPQEKLYVEATGPLSGTLRYMAPEQFHGQGDERSDLYAFGATLYELCTLKPLFHAKLKSQLITEIEAGRFVPPRQVNKNIPAALESIILKCLQLDREKRYNSADQLYADLLRFLNTDAKPGPVKWWQRFFKRK